MKYLLKLFVKSLLSPTIAPFYMGIAGLAFMYLARTGHFAAGLFAFVITVGFIGLIHVGRRATEKEENEALQNN